MRTRRSLRPAGGCSDEELVARASCADGAALVELYDRYGRVAYGVAAHVLGETELAERVVEEAFATVAGGDPGAGGIDARARLLAIVHRLAVEARRHGRPPGDRSPRGAAEPAGRSPAGRSPGARVCAALAQLPGDQREALLLAYVDGLSVDELAERLGRSRAAVAATVRTGLERLGALLADEPAAASRSDPERLSRRVVSLLAPREQRRA